MIGSIIGAALNAVLNFLARLWDDKARRDASTSAHERAGAAEAGNETAEAINEITAARADLGDMPSAPDDIARGLRARKTGADRSN